MHNTDRNILETDYEGGPFETENFEYEEYEAPRQTGHQMWSGEGESYEGYGMQGEGLFNEFDEMELAAELLEVRDEQELDQFLGNLIRKAGRAARSFIRSPAGQALGGVLKGAAKNALPLAGTALGAMVGGPLGGMLGQGVASAAGDALGVEQESLSYEDREFEGAKQFVRLAGAAVQNLASASPATDPRSAAQSAVVEAARTLAPGLLQSNGQGGQERARQGQGSMRPSSGMPAHGRSSGRWMRRGNRIVLFGV